MSKFIDDFFQVFLGLAFCYAIVWWILVLVFGFDLTGWLGWGPVLPPAD